jgi:hypothetical protein
MGRYGKKVTSVVYKKPGLKPVEVPIYLNTKTGQFTASDEQLDVGASNSNLELVKLAVLDQLEAKFAVVWEPYLAVVIIHRHDSVDSKDWLHGDSENEHAHEIRLAKDRMYDVGLLIKPVMLGTYPDKSEVWRERDSSWEKPGRPKVLADVESRFDGTADREKAPLSLLPDTPERRQALETIWTQFSQLYQALRQATAPDVLDQLLVRVGSGQAKLMFSGTPALPAPAAKKGAKRGKGR